jgi:hypothetical protein
MKILHWITFWILQLKSSLFKKKLVHLGKDYFIYHWSVIEIKWLRVLERFKYKTTVQFLTWTKFYINWKTVIDIEDWFEILYHDVNLRKNSIWFIVDNQQFNTKFELMDEGDVYTILYSILITRIKAKKWWIYKVFNVSWELLHQFPTYWGMLHIQQEWEYIICTLWKKIRKEIHIGWFKDVIKEIKE